MATPVLSPEGTLLLPVAPAAVGLSLPHHKLLLGNVDEATSQRVFYPKTELHLTVFGYATGRLVRAACATEPELETRINDLVADHVKAGWLPGGGEPPVWRTPPYLPVLPVWYLLTRGSLQTVIRRVAADYSWIYRELATRRGVDEKLQARLAIVPPAHVTCYTTDPAGKAGIGVNSDDDLKPDGPLRAVLLKGLLKGL